MTKGDLAKLIKSFVDGSCGEWDWDDFTSVKQKDPEIELVRKRINAIPDDFPSDVASHWCNKKGIQVLLEISKNLSSSP